MAHITITKDVTVMCHRCNYELTARQDIYDHLIVEPCPPCLRDARAKGKASLATEPVDAGRDEGSEA